MIKILRKFFLFSGKENQHKFYQAMLLGVLIALIQAMRIPAAYIVIKGLLEGNLSATTAWISCGLVAGSVILSAAISMKSTMLQTEAGFHAATQKRIEIAEHLRYVPMGYFNEQSLGEITSVATTTMETLGNIGTRVTMIVSKGYLTTAMILLMLFIFDIRIASIALAGILLFLLLSVWMQKATAQRSKMKLDADEALTGKVLEYVQGITEVKHFNLICSEITKVNNAIKDTADANTALEFAAVSIVFLQNIVIKLTGAAMMLTSILFYLAGSMPPAECIMMIISSFMIFEALDQAGSYSALLKALDLCVDRGNEALASPSMQIEGAEVHPSHYNLSMEHVDFAYDTKKIIDDLSLTIPEKKLTAIIGPSGSGKTTITQLLARFWDVNKGHVYFNGMDVREYSYDSLMKNYAFVFQRVYLFQDTIAANIAFGMQHADRSAVIEAAKKACCHAFISALPNGYDTIIGEGGATLSGGEKQRISIARAIMKDAPVIVLDEATANLDPENEAELVKAIEALTKDKTVIMIAHRLKTVRDADQILVVDHGRIVQKGSHETLIEEEGIYRRFVKDRSRAIIWRPGQSPQT